MGHEPVVTLDKVSFAFNGTPVLEDVTLEIQEREFVSMVGPNGGGKTTMLRLILGLLRPVQGEVRVFGRAPERVRERIGYTPQHAMYDPRFPVTVIDVVLMGCLTGHWGGAYSRRDRDAASARPGGDAARASRGFAVQRSCRAGNASGC